MNPRYFKLIDGSKLLMDLASDDVLCRYCDSPRAQVDEMIRQINRANYYADVFPAKNDLIFLDLGANLGLVSLWASPICTQVVAVEPEPTTFVMLKSLMARFAPNVQCLAAALDKTTGTANLSIDRQDYSCHTITNPKPGNCAITVQTYSFPDLVKRCGLQGGIDVCKVDIEGAEMDSLTDEVLVSAPVKTWYIEVHKTPLMPREKSAVLMTARLKKAGYTVTSPRPNALVAKWQ